MLKVANAATINTRTGISHTPKTVCQSRVMPFAIRPLDIFQGLLEYFTLLPPQAARFLPSPALEAPIF